MPGSVASALDSPFFFFFLKKERKNERKNEKNTKVIVLLRGPRFRTWLWSLSRPAELEKKNFFLLIRHLLNFFFFLSRFFWFFQVLKRRKSWVRCYFPATRSGRVWREIGTDWFTASTPSKPSIATLAASIWLPILDRPWSSGWTLWVWRPFYKTPRVYPSREK